MRSSRQGSKSSLPSEPVISLKGWGFSRFKICSLYCCWETYLIKRCVQEHIRAEMKVNIVFGVLGCAKLKLELYSPRGAIKRFYRVIS